MDTNWSLYASVYDIDTGGVLISRPDNSTDFHAARYNIFRDGNKKTCNVSIRASIIESEKLDDNKKLSKYAVHVMATGEDPHGDLFYYKVIINRNSNKTHYERVASELIIPELTHLDLFLNSKDDMVALNSKDTIYTLNYNEFDNLLELLIDGTYCFRYRSDQLTIINSLSITFSPTIPTTSMTLLTNLN